MLAMAAGLTACGESKKAAQEREARVGMAVLVQGIALQRESADIRAARQSSVVFKIFPLHSSSSACEIPRGGPNVPGKMRLAGTCITSVRTSPGPGLEPVIAVVFTEEWRYPSGSKHVFHATWIVPVKDRHALKGQTVTKGSTPPQSWV